MNKLSLTLIMSLVSFSASADSFGFRKPEPVTAFESTAEIMTRINSIEKSAAHCARARVLYFSTKEHMRGGKSACDDYYDWKNSFFPRYNLTNDSFKTGRVKEKLSYFIRLEEED